MKRLALVGFPDGLARQDIAPTTAWRSGAEVIDYWSNKLLNIQAVFSCNCNR